MMNMKSMVVAFLMAGVPVLAAQAACEPYDGFVLDGGTATDPRTGLTWKRCVVGQTWDEEHKKCKGSIRPLDWFDAIDVAVSDRDGSHDDWRVPSSYEIWSLFYCKTEKTYWHGGMSNKHSYPINFDVFPLPDHDYGDIWTVSSGYSGSYKNGVYRSREAEVFSLNDRVYDRFHSAISSSDRWNKNWVLLVRGGGVNPQFEKAKEHVALQKELDEAMSRRWEELEEVKKRTLQAILDNQVMRIKKVEDYLYSMDHYDQKE